MSTPQQIIIKDEESGENYISAGEVLGLFKERGTWHDAHLTVHPASMTWGILYIPKGKHLFEKFPLDPSRFSILFPE